MIIPVGMNGWRVRSVGEGAAWGTYKQAFFAVAPGCPETAHPTRDCDCQAFKRREYAVAYIRQRDD